MNERILVVDDEPEVLRICSRALAQAKSGYETVTVTSAQQARDCLGEQDFDVLILDIHLPEENGLVLLKQLRDTHPDLPVILITGYPAVNTVIDAVRMNVRQYLCKPFTVPSLLDAVESILREAHA